MLKTCVICGGEFEAKSPRYSTCSAKCKGERQRKYGKERYAMKHEQMKERDRKYRMANREKIKERGRKYYVANREKILERDAAKRNAIVKSCRVCGAKFETRHKRTPVCSAKCRKEWPNMCVRERRAANREQHRNYNRKYRAIHIEQFRERDRERYAANRELINKRLRERRAANQGLFNERDRERYARYRAKILIREQSRRDANREFFNARQRRYDDANREELNARRRLNCAVNFKLIRARYRQFYKTKAAALKALKELGVTFDHLPTLQDKLTAAYQFLRAIKKGAIDDEVENQTTELSLLLEPSE